MATPPLGFQDSQCAVYSHPRKVPLIGDVIFNVNTQFLMHLVNFFRQHLTQASEHTLYELFRELGDHEKPRAWDSKLYNGPGVKKLGRYWKGTFGEFHWLIVPPSQITS